MVAGKNNPRVFAETITLDAWRAPFDGERGEADLHIDVVFAEGGRVGGDDSPIRFRLSLRRAEVHVIRDSEDIIQIKPETVMRAALPRPAKSLKIVEKKGLARAGAGVKVSEAGASGKLELGTEGAVTITEKLEQAAAVPNMNVTHWKTEDGYGFKIAGAKGGLRTPNTTV